MWGDKYKRAQFYYNFKLSKTGDKVTMVKPVLVGGSDAIYPFLQQLPFLQLDNEWEETGTPHFRTTQGAYLLFLSSITAT